MSPRRCTCQPGSHDNGWHEVRCADCIQDERDVWSRMLALFRGRTKEQSETLE